MNVEEFFDTFPQDILDAENGDRKRFPGKKFNGKQWIDEETGFYCAITNSINRDYRNRYYYGYVGFKITPYQGEIILEGFFSLYDGNEHVYYKSFYYDPRSGHCIVVYGDDDQEKLTNTIKLKCPLLKSVMSEVLR